MRLRQVIEALEKAERDNPDLKDWDVRVAHPDQQTNDHWGIVDNIRITGKGVEIVHGNSPRPKDY